MQITIHKSLLLQTVHEIESGEPITFSAVTGEESARLPELLQIGAAACCVAVRRLAGVLGAEKFLAGDAAGIGNAGPAARKHFLDQLLKSAHNIALTVLPDLRGHEACCKRMNCSAMVAHFAGHFAKRTAIEPQCDGWMLSALAKLAASAVASFIRRTQAEYPDLDAAGKAGWSAFVSAADLAAILSSSPEVAAAFGEVVTIETNLNDAGRPTLRPCEGCPTFDEFAELNLTIPRIFMEESATAGS